MKKNEIILMTSKEFWDLIYHYNDYDIFPIQLIFSEFVNIKLSRFINIIT